MMKTFLTSAAILVAVTSTAFAGSNAASESTSTNATTVNAIAMTGGGSGNGGTTRIENTPDAYAPSLPGGNPCIVGMSAGVSMPGIGIAGGGGYQDKECELRQQTALLANMGLGDAAIVLMCQNNPNLYKALVATGHCRGAAPAQAPATQRAVSSRNVPATPSGVCEIKAGTTRTVVTNWADKRACARQLGVL